MARYFLHDAGGTRQFFWRSVQSFAGVHLHLNLNLLARALGDRPPLPARTSLVAPRPYDTAVPAVGIIELQPFVTSVGGTMTALPIGDKLRDFLDDPLENGTLMELSLPVYDSKLNIGDAGGGWFRDEVDDTSFHCGWDVMPESQRSASHLFEVGAAQDGVVEALSKRNNASIVLRHSRGGKDFLTVYQHLDLTSCPLEKGDPIRRGQFLARISDTAGTRHLHFMVAVLGPEFLLPSGQSVPALWYAIDAFGVYDYYNNRTSRTAYNYVPDLPPDCFNFDIRGAEHTIQWAAQPLARTIPMNQQTDYLKIIRIQFRAQRNDARAGLPPAEHNQCLVWLEGVDDFFFVPFDSSGDNMLELKMVDFLGQCFDRGRKVKLEHYPVGDSRFIAAVWANAE